MYQAVEPLRLGNPNLPRAFMLKEVEFPVGLGQDAEKEVLTSHARQCKLCLRGDVDPD